MPQAPKVPSSAAPQTRIQIVKVPITITIKEVEAENRKRHGKQCPSVYSGRTSMRFCHRRTNHEGDHRADGVQWREEEVPMTPREERAHRRQMGDLIAHLAGRMSAKARG